METNLKENRYTLSVSTNSKSFPNDVLIWENTQMENLLRGRYITVDYFENEQPVMLGIDADSIVDAYVNNRFTSHTTANGYNYFAFPKDLLKTVSTPLSLIEAVEPIADKSFFDHIRSLFVSAKSVNKTAQKNNNLFYKGSSKYWVSKYAGKYRIRKEFADGKRETLTKTFNTQKAATSYIRNNLKIK